AAVPFTPTAPIIARATSIIESALLIKPVSFEKYGREIWNVMMPGPLSMADFHDARRHRRARASPSCASASDRAFGPERVDPGGIEAELAQDFARMLAEEGGDADRGRRGRELDGISHGDERPANGVHALDDHVTRVQVRIRQHLAGVLDGSTRHANPGE